MRVTIWNWNEDENGAAIEAMDYEIVFFERDDPGTIVGEFTVHFDYECYFPLERNSYTVWQIYDLAGSAQVALSKPQYGVRLRAANVVWNGSVTGEIGQITYAPVAVGQSDPNMFWLDDGVGPADWYSLPGEEANFCYKIEVVPWFAGDCNCDGAVNNFDIDPFVLALTIAPDFAAYYAEYPDCDPMLADCNDDGSVNNFDIDPFVGLL